MKKMLRALLGGVAPVVASAIGGPLAGTAVRMLAEKLGVDTTQIETDPGSIEKALVSKLQSATPADLLAVRQVETQFLVEMEKLDISRDQIAAMDRDSARHRQIATGDKFPNILAAIVMATFVFVLVAQFYVVLKQIPLEPGAGKVLDVSMGILMAAVTTVLTYYFGSSSGSKAKTDAMIGEKAN